MFRKFRSYPFPVPARIFRTSAIRLSSRIKSWFETFANRWTADVTSLTLQAGSISSHSLCAKDEGIPSQTGSQNRCILAIYSKEAAIELVLNASVFVFMIGGNPLWCLLYSSAVIVVTCSYFANSATVRRLASKVSKASRKSCIARRYR